MRGMKMKKTIVLICLMVLIYVISASATPSISMDCDAVTGGLQTTVECVTDATIQVGFYITGAAVSDNIDQIAARIDYNSTLMEFSSAGKGTATTEFMRDGGAGSTDIFILGLAVDSDTTDFSISIIGNHPEWAPSHNKTAMRNSFICLADGTVTCGSDG